MENKDTRGNPAWKKGGKSPNPSGRPKIDEQTRAIIQTNACKYSADALDVAYSIMMNTNERGSIRLKAVDIILDRAVGKAIQPQADDTVSIESVLEALPVIFGARSTYQHPEDRDSDSE